MIVLEVTHDIYNNPHRSFPRTARAALLQDGRLVPAAVNTAAVSAGGMLTATGTSWGDTPKPPVPIGKK